MPGVALDELLLLAAALRVGGVATGLLAASLRFLGSLV